MIDEKEIEKAAIECADEYYSVDLGMDREEVNREVFTRGARWAINSLWHDASEEPKRYFYYLVETKRGCMDVCFYDADGWHEPKVGGGDVAMWLDLKDILPKEGGEE